MPHQMEQRGVILYTHSTSQIKINFHQFGQQ